jgi:predicted Zn-dependent protease
MERFAEAASAFERGIRRHPDFTPHYIFLASCYGHLGKREEAAGAIDRAASHGSTIDQIVKFLPSWDANAALILEGLRLAGVDVAGLETGRGPG